MFKNFLMKKMLKSQMKGVPEDVQEKIFTLLEKRPDLFEKIAMDAKAKMDGGMDQMTAVMEASKPYQKELQEALGQPPQK